MLLSQDLGQHARPSTARLGKGGMACLPALTDLGWPVAVNRILSNKKRSFPTASGQDSLLSYSLNKTMIDRLTGVPAKWFVSSGVAWNPPPPTAQAAAYG